MINMLHIQRNELFKYYFAALFSLLAMNMSSAQTKEKKEMGQQSLELPIVVVQGQDKFDIPAVIKKNPYDTPPLSKSRLDSLNTLEKQRPALLPPAGLPEPERKPHFANGFAEGEIGQFFTTDLRAGLGFNAGDYRLHADANLKGSDGHIDNAGYFGYGAGLSAVYIAPEQFIFFGGSRTESAMQFGMRSYKLYGKQEQPLQDVPDRNTASFSIGANISGLYDDYSYTAKGSWSASGIEQNKFDATDNGLAGSLSIVKKYTNFSAGLKTTLDFHTFRGTGYHYIELSGVYSGTISGVLLEAEAGVQTVSSTVQTTSSAFYAVGNFRLPLSSLFSASASIRTGLARTSFAGFLAENPYLSSRSIIDFEKTDIGLSADLYYHPLPSFYASIGGKLALRDNSPFFKYDTLGMFGIDYASITQAEINTEAIFSIGNGNTLTANVSAISAKFKDGNGSIPYVPIMRTSGIWSRSWSERVSSQLSAVWYGERYADRMNKLIIDGWLDIGLRMDYALQTDISFFVKITNLTNSTIIIWEGYRERGVAAMFGALIKF